MDKTYWENYYRQHTAPEEPSRFAQYVADNYITEGQRLIELGCGNGRDAAFFGSKGIQVVAIDQASSEIEELSAHNDNREVEYRSGDFTSLETTEAAYDLVYSRFTLHSITANEQQRTLRWAERALKIGGYLCVEVRGQKNHLFGMGEPVEGQPDAYIYEEHYRRFLNRDDLDREVGMLGLRIVASDEEQGYAPFGNTDDFFIRQVSQKD